MLGPARQRLAEPVFMAVQRGVWMHLAIKTLLDGVIATASRSGAHWYPRHGHVYYANQGSNQAKMHVVITDDDWNSTQPFVEAVRLTSKSKVPRAQWETMVPGGVAVVGNLVMLPVDDIERTVPRPPRPERLQSDELRSLGLGLTTLLGLASLET